MTSGIPKHDIMTARRQNIARVHQQTTASDLPNKHTRHGGAYIGAQPIPHERVVVFPTGPLPNCRHCHPSGDIR